MRGNFMLKPVVHLKPPNIALHVEPGSLHIESLLDDSYTHPQL